MSIHTITPKFMFSLKLGSVEPSYLPPTHTGARVGKRLSLRWLLQRRQGPTGKAPLRLDQQDWETCLLAVLLALYWLLTFSALLYPRTVPPGLLVGFSQQRHLQTKSNKKLDDRQAEKRVRLLLPSPVLGFVSCSRCLSRASSSLSKPLSRFGSQGLWRCCFFFVL
jgi:hypothetical protein